MKEYWELLDKLRILKSQGYIKTHRAGNTGIGKTLEDLLGIDENNIPGPNGVMIELKSARKNSKSMLTLFTKSPLPAKANTVLVQKYGYPSRKGNERKELHTTVNALAFNFLKGKLGLKVDIGNDRIELVAPASEAPAESLGPKPESPSKVVVGYWDKETLKKSFERKLPKLLYVKADSKGTGADEEFWYNEAFLLSGFDFENLINLLTRGMILVDVRIGQYPDGRAHDHGTGFRVQVDKLDLCFSHREKVL